MKYICFLKFKENKLEFLSYILKITQSQIFHEINFAGSRKTVLS